MSRTHYFSPKYTNNELKTAQLKLCLLSEILAIGNALHILSLMQTSRHITHPLHIYKDNTPYFITAAIWQHQALLDDPLKSHLVELLQCIFAEYDWQLDAWVVLDNHYHVLCQSKRGKDLSRIIAKVHNLSSQAIKAKHVLGHKVWCNYWDYCPRNEYEYHTRLCYLLNNPYKHGYVSSLHDWKWSSFHQYYQKLGKEQLRRQFQEYNDYRSLEVGGTT